MTRTHLTAGLSLLILLASSAPARAGGIAWQELGLDQALAAASERGTQVLVDVYATWCGPCQALDAEVFPTDVVGAATSDLVAVRFDAEAGEGPGVVQRYHVVGYPTVLVLRADGTEVDRIFGFMPAEEFASTVTGYRQGHGTIDELWERLAQTPGDMALAFEVGSREAIRGEYAEGQRLLDQVIAGDPDNARGLCAQAHLVLGKYMYLRGSGDYQAALREFSILQEQFPQTEEAQEAIFQSAIAYARSGDAANANAVIDRLLAQAGTDVDTYNSLAWACYREHFELQRGLAIAQQGLAIDPSDHALWDTYAELQNATGDTAGALASTQRARELAPNEEYYARQYERFSALLAQSASNGAPHP